MRVTQFSWVLCKDPIILGPAKALRVMGLASGLNSLGSHVRPKGNRSYIRTQFSHRTQFFWVRRQDPILMGHASGCNSLESSERPKANGSIVRAQENWVLRQDPILLGPASGPKVL
jgi:hypothetical protein